MNNNKTKRVACDRCRDQKLRCPRVSSTAEQCARCLRARAKCVTSSARPNGRPRNEPLAMANQVPLEPGIQTNRPLSSPGANTDAYADLFGLLSFPSAAPTVPSEQTGMNHTTSPRQTETGVMSFGGLEQLGEGYDGEPNALEFGRGMDMAESHFLESIVNYDHSDSAVLTTKSFGITEPDEPNVVLKMVADPRIRLSKLSESIAQQLNKLRAYSWRPAHVQANCSAKGHGIDQNPLAQVLQSTAELVTVLQHLSSASTLPRANDHTPKDPPGSTISAPTSAPSPAPGDAPSTPTVLLILATWLQLVELYDELFSHVRDALQEMSPGAIAAFRGPMGMIGSPIPGMDLMQGDLSVKIMIEVIKHQLQILETLLGLPDEYRVVHRHSGTLGTTHATGLFSRQDVKLSGVLHTVMTDMPDAPAKATVDSLGDKIKAVQDTLGTSSN